MRDWQVAFGFALVVGGCLLPKYSVVEDGGPAGSGGGPGTAGSGGGRGAGGVASGAAGTGTTGVAGISGSAGGGGRGGVAGSIGPTGGTGGAIVGVAGSGSGTAGAGGGSAGRGGTTGTAGAGGGLAGRGGTTGAAGTGAAGRGGTTGAAGSAGRGGTTGAAGNSGGRGGSSAGTGGGAAGGSTVAPSWLQSLSAVWQFDGNSGQLGVEAHGIGTLHLEEQGLNIPQPSPTAIEGGSVSLIGSLDYPSYLQTPGTTLPNVFQTGPSNSFTTGGWFRITATTDQQWLVHDEGPTTFEQGGFYFLVDQQVGKLSQGTAYAYCRLGTKESTGNYKEVATDNTNGVGDLATDSMVGGGWLHLVCRYDASRNELTILVGGVRRAIETGSAGQASTGPGPFMIGCNEAGYCALQGNVDEVFFTTSALPDPDVKRIYACGIDGSRCRCSGPNYLDCGFLPQSAGPTLPACNSDTPP